MQYGVLLALLFAPLAGAVDILETLPVDQAWSGHSVGFSLLTDAPMQYVAYYNAGRELIVASRRLDEAAWARNVLPEKLGWDSHNSVTMAVDARKQLHLSGNMHCVPLVYFKMSRPRDILSIRRLTQLIGSEESRATYPNFFSGPAGEFIFTYRDGSSGNGNQIYDVYNPDDGSWSRLLDEPLTDGKGLMNAYIHGPRLGPDGLFHMVWVWRDTPDCATNHDISYMRSRDLRHWENIRGESLALPVTIDSPGTIVDPVPPGGGLINGNATLGFDRENRPIVTYHKYDRDGFSQVFNARWGGREWTVVAASQWNSRWDFSGGGSIVFDVRVGAVQPAGEDGLAQEWTHWQLGRERWRVDPQSLRAVERLALPAPFTPPGFGAPQGTFPGLQVRTATDRGHSPDPDTRFVLRWETLGPNRDRPREPPLPEPSPLVLYKLGG